MESTIRGPLAVVMRVLLVAGDGKFALATWLQGAPGITTITMVSLLVRAKGLGKLSAPVYQAYGPRIPGPFSTCGYSWVSADTRAPEYTRVT